MPVQQLFTMMSRTEKKRNALLNSSHSYEVPPKPPWWDTNLNRNAPRQPIEYLGLLEFVRVFSQTHPQLSSPALFAFLSPFFPFFLCSLSIHWHAMQQIDRIVTDERFFTRQQRSQGKVYFQSFYVVAAQSKKVALARVGQICFFHSSLKNVLRWCISFSY